MASKEKYLMDNLLILTESVKRGNYDEGINGYLKDACLNLIVSTLDARGIVADFLNCRIIEIEDDDIS